MNLKKLILDEMDKKDDLTNARYIYLKLGEYLTFSTTFPNTDVDTMNKLHKKEVDIENVDSEITCNMWADIYSKLLTEVNIENQVINEWHQYVKFKIDGKTWVADATYGTYTDLARIKYGDSTERFGVALKQGYEPSIYVNIMDPDNKKLESIDNSFEFYVKRKKKREDLMKTLAKVKDLEIPLKEKMDYIFNFIGKLEYGYYEASSFVYEIEKEVLTKAELELVKATELKKNSSSVDIINCITVKGNGYHYYLLKDNLPIKEVTPTNILKLAMFGGYGIDEKKIEGIDIPRKFDIYKHDFSISFMLSDEIKPYARKTL